MAPNSSPTESPAISSATTTTSSSSTTIDDLHPDVLTRSLRLLDGATLAAACSASSHLRSLSSQSHLWLHLCLSTWPSLHHPRILPFLSTSPRSFFSDAFPFPDSSVPAPADHPHLLPHLLISAVDIYHRGVPIASRVVETETSSPWFLASPFFIDAMPMPMPIPMIISPGDLTLSWILIDPAKGRAVNASIRRAVAMERNCYTGETVVRFASPAPGEGVIGAAVTCAEGTGHVREVVLTVEDMDGACVSGEEAVKAVRGMMEAGRKGRGRGEEEAKRRYAEYVRRKRRRKESRARREGLLDMCCTAVGAAVFVAFLSLIVFR